MITVIIPLFNKAPYVRKSVLSVLNQSMPNFELLLVDNGSTDNWQEELANISDKRLRILFEPKKGVSHARNYGINEATFDWICFLDADDFWETDNLKELLTMLHASPEAGILSNSYQISDAQNNSRIRKILGVETHGNYLRVVNFFISYNKADLPVNSNSVCISKKVLQEMGGFDTTILYGEDVLLWVSVFMQYPIYINSFVGSTYQLGATNRSNVPAHLLDELPVIAQLERVYNRYKTNKILDPDFHAFIAKHLFVNVMAHIKSGNRQSARRFFKDNRLWLYPQKVTLLAAAYLCFAPSFMANPIARFLMKKGWIN